MTQAIQSFLKNRRSVLANNLSDPGPDEAELMEILNIAARVPDHKKLVPWRFVLFRGEARSRFGDVLKSALLRAEPNASEIRQETEFGRFLRAPVIVGVISSLSDRGSVPEWEQILSAGAVCQNMLNAVGAYGYYGQWLTEWYAYDEDVISALKVDDSERVAGFVYIGTATEAPKERQRPELSDIVTDW